MKESVGVALIGTGMWGRRIASALRRTQALRLVTCFNRAAEAREAFAREFDCGAAPSLEAALETPGVEAALLITPNYAHAEGTLACAERRLHVYVEKPIADSLEDGRAMQMACQAAGVTLMIGHGFRRLGASRKMKSLIEDGVLGEIVLAEANFSLPARLSPDTWRSYRKTCPGGALMQLGVHHADTLQYLLGPISEVQGSFARLVTQAEIDDVGVASLGFAGGERGVITSSYVSPKTYSLRLFGTKGVLTALTDMTIWPNAERMDPSTNLVLQDQDGHQSIGIEARDMLVEELNEFATCVRGGGPPETGAAEGLQALNVILAAIQSHERRQTMSVMEL